MVINLAAGLAVVVGLCLALYYGRAARSSLGGFKSALEKGLRPGHSHKTLGELMGENRGHHRLLRNLGIVMFLIGAIALFARFKG